MNRLFPDVTKMPIYRCHKQVRALRILSVVENVITPESINHEPFEVTHEWINKHNPQAGGYFVLYQDGYTSYSPAEAFEAGYSRAW